MTILAIAEIAPEATVAWHTHPGVETAYVIEGGGTSWSVASPIAMSTRQTRSRSPPRRRTACATAIGRRGSHRPTSSRRTSRSPRRCQHRNRRGGQASGIP
jgi:hypothetical protein